MREILLFTLYTPLAAMGEVAVGERRIGLARPGRSAFLGLVAAALGIERRDEAAHAALERGYGLAVRVEAEGALLQDYHTAQVPPARKGRRWATRRAELAEPRLETILSTREYRSDARHTVALWAGAAPPHPLATIAEALRRPRFTLYFGRKACPLGLPPAPRSSPLRHSPTPSPASIGSCPRRNGPRAHTGRSRPPPATSMPMPRPGSGSATG